MNDQPNQMYALFVLEKPDNLGIPIDEAYKSWHAFLQGRIGNIVRPGRHTEILGENVYLIPLHLELPVFAALVDACAGSEYRYKTLFVTQAPQWIVLSGSRAKPTGTSPSS